MIKSLQELEGIRRAGKILAMTLKMAEREVVAGRKTADIDSVIEGLILSRGAVPVFKGYRGFPAASCISINEEVIHGIPGDRVIKEGDLVKIDVGVSKDGFIADAALSVPVGKVDDEVSRLLWATRKALARAIENAKAGNRVGDLSHAIEETAKETGYDVVREYFGHGTGLALHEEPNIPNFGPPGVGPRLQEGMTFAIEPMLTLGTGKVRLSSDRWTVLTADGRVAAHFEHTIAVTANGPVVLTEDG